MSASLILYTKSGCPLCDDAHEMLRLIQPALEIQEVYITDSSELVALYGTRIPVVKWPPTGEELNWPFGPADIKALID